MVPIRRLFQRELLSLLGLLAVVATVLVWWGMGRALDLQAQARAKEALDRVANDLRVDLESIERAGLTAASLLDRNQFDLSRVAEVEARFAPLLQANPRLANLVVVLASGWGLSMSRLPEGMASFHLDARQPQGLKSYLRRQGEPTAPGPWEPTPYKAFQRPWYLTALASDRARWVPAYRFINLPTHGLSFTVPLRSGNGTFQGALCADIFLETLAARMASAQPTPRSAAILVDGQDRVLLQARTDRPDGQMQPSGFPKLEALGEALFLKAGQVWEREGRPNQAFHVRQDMRRYLAAVQSIPNQDWRLILVIPDSDYLGPARMLSLVMVLVGMAVAGFAAWRLIRLARSFSQPLEALAQATHALEEGRTPEAVETSVAELHAFGEALRHAGESMQKEHDLQQRLSHSNRLVTVGSLAGGIAHDVNNQLAAIVGQLNLAKSHLDEFHAASRRIQRAEDAAHRCAGMLKSLLGFSRQAQPELVILDLHGVIIQTAHLLEHVLGGQIRVVLELSSDLPAVCGDRISLEQVLMNLGVNARDAMPQGGLLTLRTESEGPWVRLSVQDTGTGMDAELQRRIFEPFFTTKDVGKGTGLGLAMVKNIVEAHQGRIQVESTPGVGTTFHLFFPAQADTLPGLTPPENAPEPHSVSLLGKRLLIVEDEPYLRELLVDAFLQQRAHTESAPDGAQAWVLLQQGRYDLLITDHRMPEMTGLELIQRLRASGNTIPIVLSSGYGLEGQEETLKLDPRLRLVPKPFALKDMFHAALGLLESAAS